MQQPKTSIVVIDTQAHWRALVAKTLESDGFSVCTLEKFENPEAITCDNQKPDLVIFGCNALGSEEREIVRKLLRHKCPLLVLCSKPSLQEMRALFLDGVNDVGSKTYSPKRLRFLVHETLNDLAYRETVGLLIRNV